ncbi:MAG: hypothetical protein H7249_13785 [Chitinophagaceae bacterium]|nr:hypothetical protein [Oligoflexus sp.]
MIKRSSWAFFPAFFMLMGLFGCDPSHRDKCEWYLVPEPKDIALVPEGWVSLCARNFVTNKQKCYLKSELSFGKAVNGKTFRYSDMKIVETGEYPREVLKIKTCEPSAEEEKRLARLPARSEEKSRQAEPEKAMDTEED